MGISATLRIAGAQIPVTENIQANLAAIRRGLAYAKAEGADLLLTPEGSLSGYTPSFDAAAVTQALAEITAEARAAGIGLALGTCFVEPEDGQCYNELRFYAPQGQFLGFHTKTLRCGTMTEPTEGEINDYRVRPLRTFSFQGLTLGGLICNDLWANPGCTPMPDSHLTQQLAGMGAQVILHAVNGGRDGSIWSEVNWRYHEANLQMRAQAGGVWIVTVDNCDPPDLPCSAPSGVVSPAGAWVCRTAAQGEQFFVHTIHI